MEYHLVPNQSNGMVSTIWLGLIRQDSENISQCVHWYPFLNLNNINLIKYNMYDIQYDFDAVVSIKCAQNTEHATHFVGFYYSSIP